MYIQSIASCLHNLHSNRDPIRDTPEPKRLLLLLNFLTVVCQLQFFAVSSCFSELRDLSLGPVDQLIGPVDQRFGPVDHRFEATIQHRKYRAR